MSRLLVLFEKVIESCTSHVSTFLLSAASAYVMSAIQRLINSVSRALSRSTTDNQTSHLGQYCCVELRTAIESLHPDLRPHINRYFEHITGHLDEQTKRIFKELDSLYKVFDEAVEHVHGQAVAKKDGDDGGGTVEECRICLEPITDVRFGHLEECEHLYCETCLRRWMEANPGQPISCPTCRVVSHTVIFDVRPLSDAEKMIKMLSIVCFPQEADEGEGSQTTADDTIRSDFSETEDDEESSTIIHSSEEEEELNGTYEEAPLD